MLSLICELEIGKNSMNSNQQMLIGFPDSAWAVYPTEYELLGEAVKIKVDRPKFEQALLETSIVKNKI